MVEARNQTWHTATARRDQYNSATCTSTLTLGKCTIYYQYSRFFNIQSLITFEILRLHYMIGAFGTKNIHYSVSFNGTSLKFGRNIA